MEFTVAAELDDGEVTTETIEVDGDLADIAAAFEGGGAFEPPMSAFAASGPFSGCNGVQIANPKARWPDTAVCSLSTAKIGYNEAGSGAIVADRLVITAAHVVLDMDPGKQRVIGLPPVKIYPGFPEPRNKPRTPLNRRFTIFPKAYGQDVKANSHLDCAIVVTHEPTAPYGQPLGVWWDAFGTAKAPATRHVWAYGYPQRQGTIRNRYDLNGELPGQNSNPEMFVVDGPASHAGLRAFMPRNDFQHGASGGPWIAQEPSTGGWHCVGVNGQDNAGPHPGVDQSDPGVYSPLFGKWVMEMIDLGRKLRDQP